MTLSRAIRALMIAALACAAGSAGAATSTTYSVSAATVDFGGSTSASATYQVTSASSPAIATASATSPTYAMTSGYPSQLGVSAAAPNVPPTLDVISDATLLEDSGSQIIPLTGIGDGGDAPSQALAVTARSSDLTLMLDPTIVYASPASTASLLLAPLPNRYGSATITVRVTDSGGGANFTVRTFVVTVTPINDAPAIATPAGMVINENDPLQTVLLSGISAGPDESGQTLSILAFSSDPAIVPNPTITYTSPNATGVLTFTPVTNAWGSVQIFLVVSDDGGGTSVYTTSFGVSVLHQLVTPTLVTNAGLSLPVGSTAVIGFNILRASDDLPSTQILYTIGTATTKGTLKRSGVTLAAGMTFTQDDIDSGLVLYTHAGAIAESDSFTFTIRDSDGLATPLQTFAITATGGAPPNTAPVITLPGPQVTWTEGAGAIALDGTATVVDPDATLVGGTLTISTIANASVDDRLTIRNQGTGTGQIGVSGAVITYESTTIATFTGGSGSTPLTISLAGAATAVSVQAMLRLASFDDVSIAPTTAPRT
jgi:hypothetical protein